MTARRRFTVDFEVHVAINALHGDKAIQGIAMKHKIDPDRVIFPRKINRSLKGRVGHHRPASFL